MRMTLSVCLLALVPSLVLAAAVDVEVAPSAVRQGGMFLVTVSGPERPRNLVCAVDGRRLVVFDGEVIGTRRALGAFSWEETPGPRFLIVAGRDCDGEPFERRLPMTVLDGDFREEQLRVAPKMASPPPELRERIERESVLLRQVMSDVTRPLLAGAFVQPVPGIVMSPFGSKRTFNGKVASRHTGVDLRGGVGRPIRATNAGRVVLAQDLYYAGTTVVLDHGVGLFSLYAHLKALDVVEGQSVESGRVIGRVGATGRVTGPHLHWGMRLGGVTVNPLDALALPLVPGFVEPVVVARAP